MDSAIDALAEALANISAAMPLGLGVAAPALAEDMRNQIARAFAWMYPGAVANAIETALAGGALAAAKTAARSASPDWAGGVPTAIKTTSGPGRASSRRVVKRRRPSWSTKIFFPVISSSVIYQFNPALAGGAMV